MLLDQKTSNRSSLKELLSDARYAIEEAISEAPLPAGLIERIRRSMQRDGRLLTSESSAGLALLLLLSYEAASGAEPAPALPAAASFQFLLSAGDILDDLQDDPGTEVGRAAASEAVALVAALQALSHHTLNRMRVLSTTMERGGMAAARLSGFSLKALGGQWSDASHDRRSAVSIDEALVIARQKSGALGRCAAEIGAALGTADQDFVRLHGDFGEVLGTIHQLMNDIASVWSGPGDCSDLATDSPTVPLALVKSIARGVNESADTLVNLAGNRHHSVSGLQLRQMFWRSGAVHYTWGLAAVLKLRATQIAARIEEVRPASRLGALLQA